MYSQEYDDYLIPSEYYSYPVLPSPYFTRTWYDQANTYAKDPKLFLCPSAEPLWWWRSGASYDETAGSHSMVSNARIEDKVSYVQYDFNTGRRGQNTTYYRDFVKIASVRQPTLAAINFDGAKSSFPSESNAWSPYCRYVGGAHPAELVALGHSKFAAYAGGTNTDFAAYYKHPGRTMNINFFDGHAGTHRFGPDICVFLSTVFLSMPDIAYSHH